MPGRLLRLSRAAASCTTSGTSGRPAGHRALADFAQRRWKGQRPLLWGQSLRQALLDEQIYRSVILGLDRLEVGRDGTAEAVTTNGDGGQPDGNDVLVIGAGPAGLLAAWMARRRGAQVSVLAAGIGTTHIMPGWLGVLDTAEPLGAGLERWIAMHPEHPYALAGVDAIAGGHRRCCARRASRRA